MTGAGAHSPIPNHGHLGIATAGQLNLAAVLFKELAEKPVRINEVICYASQYTIIL